MEQIKPTELRIGNYYEIDGAIYQVTTINSDGCTGSLIRKPTGVHTNGRRRVGIPLTEEVLRAAGFEFKRGWKANGGEIDVDQYVLGQFDVAVASIGGIALTWRDRAINVQYLHQLQNLYFALTGQELEVSLPLIGNSPIMDNK